MSETWSSKFIYLLSIISFFVVRYFLDLCYSKNDLAINLCRTHLLHLSTFNRCIKKQRPKICLEIGSGSGVVITSLGKVLGTAYYLCTDLNPVAAVATKNTSESNKIPVDIIVTDLVEALESRLENSIDLIICNPPYAVTPNEEVGGDNLQKATSGGERGRQVIDRLFPIIPKLLSSHGMFYLTCVVENDINDIARCFGAYNLEMTVVLERRCAIERLFVLRFSFKQTTT